MDALDEVVTGQRLRSPVMATFGVSRCSVCDGPCAFRSPYCSADCRRTGRGWRAFLLALGVLPR